MVAKLRAGKVSLSAVAAAVEARDFVTALDRALAVWRATRQAQVADLIDAIAAKCQPVTIAGRSKAEFQGAWITAAHNGPGAVAIGALATTITKSLPVRDVGYLTRDRDLKRNRPFLDRIDALRKLPDDPRIARALLEIVERAPYSDSRRLYEPVLALLERLGDDRGIATLTRLIERPTAKGSSIRDYFAEALPATVKEIEGTTRMPLAAEDAAIASTLLDALGARRAVAAPHRDVEKLLAEVYARPDDDAPRAVLADALLERDDPRGELISLQLGNRDGDDERKRAASLLRKHEKEWIGELAQITKNRVWRRGFLDEIELQNHAVADDAMWERLAHDPALATVRTVHKGRANADIYGSFVCSPAMRALREVTVPTTALLQRLIDAGRPLDHVVLEVALGKATAELLERLVDRTGAKRLTFTARHEPRTLIDRVLGGLPVHKRFEEVAVAPSSQVFQLWATETPVWLGAHAALAPVRRLGVQMRNQVRIVAERGERAPRIEIDAAHDFSLEWVLPRIGRYESLVIGGMPAETQVRPGLAELFAKLKHLELRGGWSRLYATTDRGRAKRARRP